MCTFYNGFWFCERTFLSLFLSFFGVVVVVVHVLSSATVSRNAYVQCMHAPPYSTSNSNNNNNNNHQAISKNIVKSIRHSHICAIAQIARLNQRYEPHGRYNTKAASEQMKRKKTLTKKTKQ